MVVTAERHVSTAQKTPIAMSVVTRQTLIDHDVHNIRSLAAIAPDVNFAEVNGVPIVTVRGISSRDITEIGDPAVSINTDGFYLNRNYGLRATMFDLDRVEVLRGPQGTLNGRNAVGGAINIVTAKPTDKFEGGGNLTYGNYNTLNFDGFINVPISQKVQVRAAFNARSHDGYRDTPPYGNADDEDAKAGRVEVAFQPFEHFNGLIEAQYVHLGGIGQAMDDIPLNYLPNGQINHSLPNIPDNGQSFSIYTPEKLDLDEKTLRWNFSYEFPYVTVSYLGGYDTMDFFQNISTGGPRLYSYVQHEWPTTMNHEIRFSSFTRSRFTWQAGVYFFQENSNLYTYNAIPKSWSPLAKTNLFDYNVNTDSVAGYVQAGYRILPNLQITGGFRYNYDSKVRYGHLYVANQANTPFTYKDNSASVGGFWTHPTFHAGINWDVTPRNMLYAKFDTGYKPGGFTDINDYGPETVKAYEIGSKNHFLNNRLEFNVDGFYENYTGQQVSQAVASVFGSSTLTLNAGSSRIYGVESSIAALIPYVGRLEANAQWLHARFVNFVAAVSGVNTQFGGNYLPQAPDLSVGLALSRTFSIPTGSLTARIDTKFETATHLTFYNYGDDRQSAYTNSNALLTYHPHHGNYYVQGYIRNLENARILANAAEIPTTTFVYRYAFEDPRTYGVTVHVGF